MEREIKYIVNNIDKLSIEEKIIYVKYYYYTILKLINVIMVFIFLQKI